MRIFVVLGLLALTLTGCSDDTGGDASSAGSSGPMTADSSTGVSSTEGTGETAEETTQAGSTTQAETTAADSSSSAEDTTAEDSTGTTGTVDFAMSSPAFEEGGVFPGTMHISGGNIHPQLDWVGAPAETMSFGVFFHDQTIMFSHSAIWNIPAGATGLPEDVEHAPMPTDVPGAVQCRNWNDQFGYGGPGSASNFYVFTLYALDTADLAAEIDENSSLGAVRSALEDHAIGVVTLSGQTNGP